MMDLGCGLRRDEDRVSAIGEIPRPVVFPREGVRVAAHHDNAVVRREVHPLAIEGSAEELDHHGPNVASQVTERKP